jgi:hypothetical protein
MWEETTLLNGFFNGEDLREIFILDEDGTSTGSGMCFCICDNKTDRLSCSENFINSKEDF